MYRKRLGEAGFSILELMIVIMLIALVMAISMPRLGDALTRQGVRGAEAAIVAMHSIARSGAIQSGRQTALHFSGNTVYVVSTNPVTGDPDTLGTVQDLGAEYNVTITSSRSSVRFDPRGIGRESDSTFVTIARDGESASLVITQWGQIR